MNPKYLIPTVLLVLWLAAIAEFVGHQMSDDQIETMVKECRDNGKDIHAVLDRNKQIKSMTCIGGK